MARKFNALYIGGLEESVNEETLHAAFIPFGEIKSIQIPRDYQENTHRGFGFVEFDLDEDAADAIENMDGAELFGKVIRCNIARQLPKMDKGKAVWSADDWIKNSLMGQEEGAVVETTGTDDAGMMENDEPVASLIPTTAEVSASS